MLVMANQSMLVMTNQSMLVMANQSMLVMIQEGMLVMIQDFLSERAGLSHSGLRVEETPQDSCCGNPKSFLFVAGAVAVI